VPQPAAALAPVLAGIPALRLKRFNISIKVEMHYFEQGNKDERSVMKKVIIVIGAGSIGQAIARRVSAGKHVLLADLR
jgi:lactate dehydrogenase-like 2-hydroxyacid dehydrogenase